MAKANLRKALAVLKTKANLKVALAALAKEKAKKENAAKKLDALELLTKEIVLKAKARAALAALAKAKALAARAKPKLKEIAKNNTGLFTAVRAHATHASRSISRKTCSGTHYLPT